MTDSWNGRILPEKDATLLTFLYVKLSQQPGIVQYTPVLGWCWRTTALLVLATSDLIPAGLCRWYAYLYIPRGPRRVAWINMHPLNVVSPSMFATYHPFKNKKLKMISRLWSPTFSLNNPIFTTRLCSFDKKNSDNVINRKKEKKRILYTSSKMGLFYHQPGTPHSTT